MKTANEAVTRFEIAGHRPSAPRYDSRCEDALWLKDMETRAVGAHAVSRMTTYRNLFILPSTDESHSRMVSLKLKAMDSIVYILTCAAGIYSVAVNNLLVLMCGTIGLLSYVVVSHVYERRAGVRREMAEKNFRSLLTSWVSLN
jgi:hypothetical protein